MKISRVCLNAPRSMILGNSSSSYKPPSRLFSLKMCWFCSEKRAIKDEKAEKKAVKDELKKQKLLKTTVSASQASKFMYSRYNHRYNNYYVHLHLYLYST